jgi:release factor glutamine methyltransferase
MSEERTWTVLQLIQWTTGFLKNKGIENSRREAEDLLGQVLELDRLKLYLAFETLPSPAELAKFRDLVARRAKREPLQYLIGWQPFLGLRIKSDSRALIPRPETERLAELALERFKPLGEAGRFADIGTGTGCLALALLKGSEGRGLATDVSQAALDLAVENAAALGLQERLEFKLGSCLEPLSSLKGPLDLLLSNPPYIPETERNSLQPEVKDYEPASALFSGPDGMAVLSGLCARAGEYLKNGAWFMLECGQGQPGKVMALLEGGPWRSSFVEKDPYGIERFVLAQKG